MKGIAILVATLLLSACGETANDQSDKDAKTSKKKRISFNNTTVPEKLLTLQNEITTHQQDDTLRNNLFGRFFCDRAEFFIIDNPQNNIYREKPQSIVLFFLDGELCQTKYQLNNNIANRLYKELGRCNIAGLDARNKKIIDNRDILVKSAGETFINYQLDNYELKWIFGDKEIRYRVEKTKDGNKFTYTEKLRKYEKQYNEIEKYC
jgi:hypothetical protein